MVILISILIGQLETMSSVFARDALLVVCPQLSGVEYVDSVALCFLYRYILVVWDMRSVVSRVGKVSA